MSALAAQHSATTCRWWIDAPDDGPANMALDQALAECCAADVAVFRFYGWREPTLSLGYFQSYEHRFGHAPSATCPVVRRTSGGGAIVHDREITYSLMVPAGHAWFGQGRTLDTLVHTALIEALAAQQINAQLVGAAARQAADDRDRFLCFTRRAAVDVLVEGHKVAGSALRRTRAATLLHGSALLARSAHAPELPGINDLVSGRLHADELRCAWLAALQHRLSGAWIASAPTADEQRRADELVDSRYRSDAWTRLR